MRHLRPRSWVRSTPLALALLGALFVFGCADQASQPTSPEGELAASRTATGQEAPGEAVPGRYIVLLDESVRDVPATARAFERAQGLDLRHVYATAVRGFSAVVPEGRLEVLRSDEAVVRVEQVRKVRLDAQQVPTGIDRIETDRNTAADIDDIDDARVDLDVAIIDSGVDTDHPDLNVAGGQNFANGPAGKFDDGNGHGTHVAGTVGAIDNGSGVVGVAPGTRVWGVRVCGNSGFCFTDDMVAGIDWVAEQKSQGTTDFAAANMSISTSDDSQACTGSSGAVHEAICGLVETGVVFSLSAGNDGREKAAYPEVLAVSALADFDGRGGGLGSPTCRSDEDETLANFSNWGSEVDIAAPGVCILSTWNDGGTNTISGTSMASPHAAGAAALYLHANGLSPASTAAGVDDIEAAITGAALDQTHACGYTNEHAGEGSDEPLLFVNATAFGGDGSCDDGSTADGDDPPTVSITRPVDGATVSGTVTIEAEASDDNGVTQVEFFVDGSSVGTDSDGIDGWTTDWDSETVSDGDHTISAEATDAAGQTSSASVAVTVDNVVDSQISLSATGYKDRGRHQIDLSWSGATSTDVDIYLDGGLLTTTDDDGAYTHSTNNRGQGSYTFEVCEAGTSTCSNSVTVTF